jgi:hypothetical protein
MNKRIKKKQRKLKNKKLCKRYPFLIIHDWEDEPLGYEFTYLDDMPEGWKRAFGIDMCEDIKRVLVKANYLYDYRIVQLKEKYGSMRLYSNGVPSSIYRELEDIIDKYEKLSYHTCICCGRPATKISLGWISPFCDECAEKLSDRIKFKEIDNVNN